jgi:hypothetical protein
MEDKTTQKQDETSQSKEQDKENQYHQEPATPIKPASDEVKPKPANESTKNSK